MSGELTLGGLLLPLGGIAAKLLAAHRAGIERVLLPRHYRRQVDEDLGDDIRRAVAVDYVTRIDELIELALHATPAADTLAAATPAGRASSAAAIGVPAASAGAADPPTRNTESSLRHA